jgi:ATP-binding cassette subfamily B protein
MERGATLSVGQRQLISFVRALVHNPKVIVLDEATSSVDTETEEMIQNAISKLMKGRTAIVIAHRLSTIQNAHKILVLDKGEIKESGTHDELLDKEGWYADLHSMQFV